MYKIGEFSELTGLSTKTLRYYDEIDLLKPSKIDQFTNYRYYGEEELYLYRKIEKLKRIGFTLDEIKNNIGNLTADFLNLKKEELILRKHFLDMQIDGIELLIEELENTKIKKLK